MLAVFDIDGTLTLSNATDGEVFAETFARVFGAALPSTNWAEYAAVSDQGITVEALKRLGLETKYIFGFKTEFIAALHRRLRDFPVDPVPGARTILRQLMCAGHRVALATGAWADAARIKLASAEVDAAQSLLVGSDDTPERQEIIRDAICRAGAEDRAVYIGDGPWDVEAAKGLSHEGEALVRSVPHDGHPLPVFLGKIRGPNLRLGFIILQSRDLVT